LQSELTCAALLGVGAALFLAIAGDQLLNDPDTHWHIATGRWIAERFELPERDPFSHTFAGQPWIAKEWLAQLALHAANTIGGTRAIVGLTAACYGASLAMVVFWMARRARLSLALGIGTLILLLTAPGILARPHILSLPLVVLWTLGILNALEQRRAPSWSLLPVMWLWSNSHAGFAIGFLIAGFAGLQAVLDAGTARWFAVALRWGAFGLAALLAACLNPYGAESLLVTAKLMGGGEPLGLIAEWQPLRMDAAGWAGVALLAGTMLTLALRPRDNLGRLLIAAALGWLMLRHGRFALLFAFSALPMLGPALAELSPRFRPQSQDGRRASSSAAWAALCFLAGLSVLSAALAALPAPSPSARVTPQRALDAARHVGLLSKRVYNSYDFGGYLIAQGVPTFIDGRTDQLFLGGFIGRHENALEDASGEALEAFITRHGAAWALVVTGSVEDRLLSTVGWHVVHRDEAASVLSKR
jgi:hypothetical protein